MRLISEPLPGVFVLQSDPYYDLRGVFQKSFHAPIVADLTGIAFSTAEAFYTTSSRNVIRGMHYQEADSAHEKLVSCVHGRVLDVVVDVRSFSPSFNQPYAIELTPSSGITLLISKPYAHGFLALEDQSTVTYCTTSIHNPSKDAGVLWSSIDFVWPVEHPIVSARDTMLRPIMDSL